jgi:hypothetical protein
MFLRPHARSKDGQGSHLLVAGRNSAHARRTAAEDGVLCRQAEQFCASALVQDRRSLQRTRRIAATEAVSLACGTAGRRSAAGARPAEPGASGADATVGRACYLGWELWKRLELDRFFEQAVDADPADVPWSRVAARLAIHRLCAPGSELAIEQRWFPSTALDDLLGVEEAQINDTRLYRCRDRILPHQTKLERHLQAATGSCSGPSSTCCCTT